MNTKLDEAFNLIIPAKGYTYEEITSLINAQNNEYDINNYINTINKNWVWQKNLKLNSDVFAILIQNKEKFQNKFYNIRIEKVINILSTLMSYCELYNIYTYTRVPDRLLGKRSQLSRDTIRYILNELRKLNLVNIKIKSGKVLFKLPDFVLQDEYFKYQNKKYKNKVNYKAVESEIKFKTLFFDDRHISTLNAHQRETILGISTAYTELVKDTINGVIRTQDIKLYGERQDIKYIQVPIPILSIILNKSEAKLNRYMDHFCNGCDYITKHDRVYVESKNSSNYYNELYKQYNLESTKDITLDDTHPIITDNSYILFMENYKTTKTYKKVTKNMDYYRDLLQNYISLYNAGLLNDLYIQDKNDTIDNMIEESNNQETNIMNDCDFEFNENSNKSQQEVKTDIRIYKDNMSIIDIDYYKEDKLYYKSDIKFNMKDMTIIKAISKIKVALKRISDIEITLCNREYNRYVTIITKLTNWIQNGLDYFKNNNKLSELNYWINCISKNNLTYNFKF